MILIELSDLGIFSLKTNRTANLGSQILANSIIYAGITFSFLLFAVLNETQWSECTHYNNLKMYTEGKLGAKYDPQIFNKKKVIQGHYYSNDNKNKTMIFPDNSNI